MVVSFTFSFEAPKGDTERNSIRLSNIFFPRDLLVMSSSDFPVFCRHQITRFIQNGSDLRKRLGRSLRPLVSLPSSSQRVRGGTWVHGCTSTERPEIFAQLLKYKKHFQFKQVERNVNGYRKNLIRISITTPKRVSQQCYRVHTARI